MARPIRSRRSESNFCEDFVFRKSLPLLDICFLFSAKTKELRVLNKLENNAVKKIRGKRAMRATTDVF